MKRSLLAVVIHDDPSLRDFFAEALTGWLRHDVHVETTSYAARLPGPMKRWMDEAELFVLGLERHYPEGRCAEGIDTALMLWKLGKRVLVVGSECCANQVDSPSYWDIESELSFLAAVKRVLEGPGPSLDDRERVASFFERRRQKPVGHGSRDR